MPAQEVETASLAFLARHGFEAHREERKLGTVVSATSGTCRLRLIDVGLTGWNRDVLLAVRANGDQIAFVFDGVVYPDQPLVRTTLTDVWARLRRKIGMIVPAKVVLGVAASPGCLLDRLPWREVADI